MPSTSFSPGTVIQPDWLNDVNFNTYLKETNIKYYTPLNGVGDDTAGLQAALNATSALGGGAVVCPQGFNVIVNENLTIPSNVHLIGPHKQTGINSNVNAQFGTVTGKLILNPTKTITLNGGCSVSGFFIVPSGMTFPQHGNSSSWTGTVFTAVGDDVAVFQNMIIGFNRVFYSTGKQRPRIYQNNIDCHNGIDIDNCADISYITRNHCWPFTTISSTTKLSNWADRNIGFKFTTLGDWNKLTDNFCYGYLRSYFIQNCNSMTFLSCGSDGTQAYAGSIGFYIDVGCHDTRLIGCQGAATEVGCFVNSSANVQTRLIGCDFWGITTHGVLVSGGDVRILGGVIRTSPYGITITNAASRVFVNAVRFESIGTSPIQTTVATNNVYIGTDNEFLNWTAPIILGTVSPLTLVAADPLNLPATGNYFVVTGNTNFGTVNNGWAGREITLVFTGTPTLFDGGSSLKLNGNFVATADSTIRLIHNGTHWCEVSRSINT